MPFYDEEVLFSAGCLQRIRQRIFVSFIATAMDTGLLKAGPLWHRHHKKFWF
jgi:hypothetical protein